MDFYKLEEANVYIMEWDTGHPKKGDPQLIFNLTVRHPVGMFLHITRREFLSL